MNVDVLTLVCHIFEGPFTNYVTHFLLVFDHPPTYSNVLAIILLMTFHTRVCNSHILADHPPTPIALRNMWTASNRSIFRGIYSIFIYILRISVSFRMILLPYENDCCKKGQTNFGLEKLVFDFFHDLPKIVEIDDCWLKQENICQKILKFLKISQQNSTKVFEVPKSSKLIVMD